MVLVSIQVGGGLVLGLFAFGRVCVIYALLIWIGLIFFFIAPWSNIPAYFHAGNW
jgi:hypothetical protein